MLNKVEFYLPCFEFSRKAFFFPFLFFLWKWIREGKLFFACYTSTRQDTINDFSLASSDLLLSRYAMFRIGIHRSTMKCGMWISQNEKGEKTKKKIGKWKKSSPRSTFVIDNPRRGDRITRKQIDVLRYFMKPRDSLSSDSLLIAAAFLTISDERQDDVDELCESRRSFFMQIQLRSILDLIDIRKTPFSQIW